MNKFQKLINYLNYIINQIHHKHLFIKKIEERAKHLNKESNFNKLAKDYSNLLKNKKIVLQYIIQESKETNINTLKI